MPVIPFAATVGAALGTSAAVGGTIVAGAALGLGSIAYGAISQAQAAKAAKSAMNQSITPDASQQVTPSSNTTSYANNLGRAALIATSPQGVMGMDPNGRRKLLGN